MWEHIKAAGTLAIVAATIASAMVWSMTQFVDLAEEVLARKLDVIHLRERILCERIQNLELKHMSVDPVVDCSFIDRELRGQR